MLEYIALGILVFVAITLFYGVIVIHDIPYEIAKHRNHPQQDAIHVAGWVSLFLLSILWPFLWIWATLYREDRGWGFDSSSTPNTNNQKVDNYIDNQKTAQQLAELTQRIEFLEQKAQNTVVQQNPSHDSFSETESAIIANQEGSK